jgi:hypothetical protein
VVTVDLIGAVFGCGGCPFQLGFGLFGAQIGLGFELLGLLGVLSRWTIGLGPEFGLVNGQQPSLTLTLTVLTGLAFDPFFPSPFLFRVFLFFSLPLQHHFFFVFSSLFLLFCSFFLHLATSFFFLPSASFSHFIILFFLFFFSILSFSSGQRERRGGARQAMGTPAEAGIGAGVALGWL